MMNNYRDYIPDYDYDFIDTKKDWMCYGCYTKNWLSRDNCRNKNCGLSKNMFEPTSDDDWIKLKSSYSDEINDTNKWKFNKLSNNLLSNATIYDRIIASQQAIFLQLAHNNQNLKFTIELDTVPESAISYARDLIKGSDMTDGKSVKEDTVTEFVSTLYHNYSLLFLKTSKVYNKIDIDVIMECIKNNAVQNHCDRKRFEDYRESYEKIMAIIIKQSDDPELCDRIRESIIKKYRQYITKNTCSLTYPVYVRKYRGFIENPFFDSSFPELKNNDGEWVNDESELWSFILKKYVYDDVRLCVEIIDNKHVRFCWAWTDHSW